MQFYTLNVRKGVFIIPKTERNLIMDENKNGLDVSVSIKDTWHFQRLLEILSKVITDERISKKIRQEYFDDVNASFELQSK